MKAHKQAKANKVITMVGLCMADASKTKVPFFFLNVLSLCIYDFEFQTAVMQSKVRKT